MDTFNFCVVLFLCGYTKAMSIGGQTYISKREDEYVQRIFYDRERQEKQKLQETLLQYVKEKYVPMRNQNGKYFNIRHYDYLLETLFHEKDARQKLQNVVNTLQMKMENLTSRTMLQSDIVFKDLEKTQASIKQLQKKNSDLESNVNRFQAENKNMERNLTFLSDENDEMRKANKALNRDVDKLKGLKTFKDIHEQKQRNFSNSLELIFGQVEIQTSDILTLKQSVKGLRLQNSNFVIKITTIDKKYANLSQDVYKAKFEREAMKNEVNVLKELDVKNALKRTDAEVKEIRAEDTEITQGLEALRNVTLTIKRELDTVKYGLPGIAPSLTCLSCSGVDAPTSCHNTTSCEKDEVCYIHKYKTTKHNVSYDLGCKHAFSCLNKHHPSRRTDSEVHLTCESCCSEFSLCNHNLNCNHTIQNVLNESCLSNSECSGNLICNKGRCACPTDDYFWSNYTCKLRKTPGQQCNSLKECSYPLQCHDNLCNCQKGQYWNITQCNTKGTITEKCKSNDECMDTLFCVHGVCKCDKIDFWTGHNCTAKQTYHEACLTNNDCHEKQHCSNNICECFQTFWNGRQCQREKPLECADINFYTEGVFLIYPTGNQSVRVYCLYEDGIKWTVFQRRLDGSVDFNKTWNEYKVGFGNVSSEFWLGNKHIHTISANGRHKLRIEMTKVGGQRFHAGYSEFRVADENDKYRLTATGYSGTAGDSMNFKSSRGGMANTMKFSTYDQDNDAASYSCAVTYSSGWWYSNCYHSNLNRYRGSWDLNIGARVLDRSMMMTTKY